MQMRDFITGAVYSHNKVSAFNVGIMNHMNDSIIYIFPDYPVKIQDDYMCTSRYGIIAAYIPV